MPSILFLPARLPSRAGISLLLFREGLIVSNLSAKMRTKSHFDSWLISWCRTDLEPIWDRYIMPILLPNWAETEKQAENATSRYSKSYHVYDVSQRRRVIRAELRAHLGLC